jgi:hypothetical protein
VGVWPHHVRAVATKARSSRSVSGPMGLVGNFGDTHCGEPIELLANPLRIPGKADLWYEGLVGL